MTATTGYNIDCRKLIYSTHKAFFIVGFILASWAPLIPIVKDRLAISDSELSLLLIAFGVGSLISMMMSGVLATRFGCRTLYLISVITAIILLPAIMTVDNAIIAAALLSLFGASVGAMDVMINIQAVRVEKIASKPLMPRFHALFSLGAFAGVCTTSLLLSVGMAANTCVVLVAILVAVLLRSTISHILQVAETTQSPGFVLPKGSVIVLGLLCFIAYIVEGSMLDWSGIFLVGQHGISINHSGIGYALFSVTMTLGRFYGGFIIDKLGKDNTFLLSALLAFCGLVFLWLSSGLLLAVLAFLMIGMGIANLAPLLFSAAGNQQVMPVNLAVAAVSTIGYSGILMGPGIIGAIARLSSLSDAFLMLAILSSLLIIYSVIAVRRG